MKYYIDFDHTLYNTNALIEDMLTTLSNFLYKNGNFENYANKFRTKYLDISLISVLKDKTSIMSFLKNNFKRPSQTILKIPYNIFSLADVCSELFSCNNTEIKKEITAILENGEKYLYEDSISFLRNLKKEPQNLVYILSHNGNDVDFQNQKIRGCKLLDSSLLDATITTTESKASLQTEDFLDAKKVSVTKISKEDSPTCIDYEHGIFIDDRPKDLENLYNSIYKSKEFYPIRLFRIARTGGRYSKEPFTSNSYLEGTKTFLTLADLAKYLTRKD